MRVLILAAAGAVLLSGCAPWTPRPVEKAPPRAAALSPNDPKALICRRPDQTGSRLASKKVCRTRAEWAALAKGRGRGGEVKLESCGGATCELIPRMAGN